MQKKSDNAVPAATPCPAAAGSAAGNALEALDAAYRATTYRAACPEAPGGRLDIRIGAVHPELDRWLDRVGVACWSYLSAENPRSEPAPPEANTRRTARLRQQLEMSGKPFLTGEALADNGGWPPEAGFLVGGLGEAEACALAARCHQNAIVCGRKGGVARLVWLPGRG